jgi:hypothetical protein
MTNAQGIKKTLAYKAQSALGTPAAGSGGQLLRRRTAMFTFDGDTYENDEITSAQQGTGATLGPRKATGKLSDLLSAGTYQGLFENLLRKVAAATAAITGAGITIAASGVNFTVTRAAGDFLTGGVKAGDVFRFTAGSFTAGNLNNNIVVLAVNSATVLLVRAVNGVALTAEGPISGSTLTFPGKKIWTPITAHTNGYITFEEWYSDITKSELWTDEKIGSAALNIDATGNIGVEFSTAGLGRTRGTSQVLTTPTAESTSNVVAAATAAIVVNGVVTPVTGFQLTIDGGIEPGKPEAGSNTISDLIQKKIKVSGSFTAKFSGTAVQDLYDAQTLFSVIIVLTDNTTGTAEFVSFVINAAKVFGDAPNDGEVEIERTYPFTAQIPATGGSGIATEKAIISMQDSLAA